MAESKNINFQISTGTILKIVGIILALFLVYYIRETVIIVLVSIILAAVIEPAVDKLEKHRIPRVISVIFIYVSSILFIAVLIDLLIPPIAEQINLLIDNFPQLWDRLVEQFSIINTYSIQSQYASSIQQGIAGVQSSLQEAVAKIYSFLLSIFSGFFNLIVILVISFYLVVYKNYVQNFFVEFAPPKYHKEIDEIYGFIKNKIGDWARGQLILSLFVGFLAFLGLIWLVPKYALLLAIIVALTEMFPYIGPIIGGIPAVFLALAIPPFSIWRGLAVVILYIIIQQAENNIIYPQVMNKTVGLHPITVMIVMLIGWQVAGIMGIILAVPVTSAISIIFKYFVKKVELEKLEKETTKQQKII